MKTYHLTVWAFILLLLPLMAVECKKKAVEANKFEVKVRVTGENLAGLGAEIKAESRRNVLNPITGPSLSHTYAAAVSQTYDLGTFGLQDDATISAFFTNVTCSSAVQPASNSRLKVELLINNRAVNTIELSPTSRNMTGFSCSPFWVITTVGSGDDWDD